MSTLLLRPLKIWTNIPCIVCLPQPAYLFFFFRLCQSLLSYGLRSVLRYPVIFTLPQILTITISRSLQPRLPSITTSPSSSSLLPTSRSSSASSLLGTCRTYITKLSLTPSRNLPGSSCPAASPLQPVSGRLKSPRRTGVVTRDFLMFFVPFPWPQGPLPLRHCVTPVPALSPSPDTLYVQSLVTTAPLTMLPPLPQPYPTKILTEVAVMKQHVPVCRENNYSTSILFVHLLQTDGVHLKAFLWLQTTAHSCKPSHRKIFWT